MSGRVLVAAVLLAGVLLAGLDHPLLRGPAAQAFPAFKRQFEAKYLVKDTPLYAAYGGRSRCNVCHLGGAMDREHRNDYGQALEKLLDRADAEALSVENSRRDPQAARAALRKIDRAFETVEAFETVDSLPADPRQKAPPTFGQLIREGKLPISPMTLPAKPSAR